MFTHPEHVIAIHRRQVLEATHEHERDGHHQAAATRKRPVNRSKVFGRVVALLRRQDTPALATRESAVAAQQ